MTEAEPEEAGHWIGLARAHRGPEDYDVAVAYCYPDGGVHHVIEHSADRGESRQVFFDGTYVTTE